MPYKYDRDFLEPLKIVKDQLSNLSKGQRAKLSDAIEALDRPLFIVKNYITQVTQSDILDAIKTRLERIKTHLSKKDIRNKDIEEVKNEVKHIQNLFRQIIISGVVPDVWEELKGQRDEANKTLTLIPH